MADKKITELPSLLLAGPNCVFPIVEISVPNETKKIKLEDLMGSPGAIGSNNPNVGHFTSFRLFSGTDVNEISTDGTLFGNSNDVIPTEQAVKTYVDNIIVGSVDHNNLTNLQGGDSTASEYYHLEKNVYDGIFSTPGVTSHIGVGDLSSTSLQVLYNGDNSITLTTSGVIQLRATHNGVKLRFGTYVSEFSVDGTLSTNSDDKIPTEQAVKTYVDNMVSAGEAIKYISTDTTAFVLDVLLIDSTSGDINVYLDSSSNGRISLKKITGDSNQIIVRGVSGELIDGYSQFVFNVTNESYAFISYNDTFYII